MTTLLPTLRESFLASDGAASDFFGRAVSSNSDATIIAVGARFWEGTETNGGAVYILSWNGSAYIEQAKIEPDTPTASYFFGYDVSLNDDGTILAVGAAGAGVGAKIETGKVFIFTGSGASWAQRDEIDSPEVDDSMYFGSSVSLNAGGDKLVIGSEGFIVGGIANKGCLYTFGYSASAWSQTSARLESTLQNKYFGQSASISGDGSTLAVGEGDGTAPKYGSVHIYDLEAGEWDLRYIIYNAVQSDDDRFSSDVSLTANGSLLYVGAMRADLSQTNQGKVYKFTLGVSAYIENGEFIRGGVVAVSDYFGSGVATNNSGDVVIVGMYGTSSSQGTVQAFDFMLGDGAATLLLDANAVGEHDMIVSYASNPVVLINATAEGHAQNVGTGSALLLAIASASGYYPINGDGSAVISISTAGKGQLRNAITRQLNQESELSIGFIESIRHLDQESGLNAFLQKQRQLDQENKISTYQSGQRRLNQEGKLNAYEPKRRVLNQENSLFVAQQYVRQLNQEMALSAYEQAQRKFNQESKLSAYELRQRYLNQESSLPILVEVIRHLNQESEIGAYEPKVRHFNQENSTSVYKTVIRYLNGEYSIKVALQKIRQLNQSSELHAYEQRTRHLNQESSLLAYMPVVRFLDICYKLQADEKFFTFATNLETGATSEYTKYEFNSLSDGIGASSSGIYDLTGSTGDGADIDVLLELGKSDFGKIAFKRVTDSYLGVSSDGNLKLTVTTESGTASYTLSPSTNLETVKSNLARGHKGRWWSVKVENIDGSSIELESIEVLIQLLSRNL